MGYAFKSLVFKTPHHVLGPFFEFVMNDKPACAQRRVRQEIDKEVKKRDVEKRVMKIYKGKAAKQIESEREIS